MTYHDTHTNENKYRELLLKRNETYLKDVDL